MGALLKDTHRLLASTLPAGTMAANMDAHLCALAGDLPDVLAGGYEIRLQDGAEQVDLQLCVRRGSGDVAILLSYLAAQVAADGAAQATWAGLEALVKDWALEGSALHTGIGEIWLEFDCIPGTPPGLPSVFVGLAEGSRSAQNALAVLDPALSYLVPGFGGASRCVLAQLCEACKGDQFVSHVGVMLPRPDAGLRVNVKRLDATSLPGYLQRAGYAGPIDQVTENARPLLQASDRATLCFDVAQAISPAFGVELYFKPENATATTWEGLFSALGVTQSDGLVSWQSPLRPEDHTALWPRELFAASMLATIKGTSQFERKISHVKFAVTDAGISTAKGYLWFQHAWAKTADADRDQFYSQDDIAQWQRIIGTDLHYHCGRFDETDDPETALKNAVRAFWPFIPVGARVLDLGCGWGGPARLMAAERSAHVTGATISAAQATYCREQGLDVVQADLDKPFPDFGSAFDVVFSLEMISHIKDKARFLREAYDQAEVLILSECCTSDGHEGPSVTFDDTMELCSVSALKNHVQAAGWTIQKLEDRRPMAMPTFQFWANNLEREFGTKQPTGAFDVLKRHVESAAIDPAAWAQKFPLIDIVATRR